MIIHFYCRLIAIEYKRIPSYGDLSIQKLISVIILKNDEVLTYVPMTKFSESRKSFNFHSGCCRTFCSWLEKITPYAAVRCCFCAICKNGEAEKKMK